MCPEEGERLAGTDHAGMCGRSTGVQCEVWLAGYQGRRELEVFMGLGDVPEMNGPTHPPRQHVMLLRDGVAAWFQYYLTLAKGKV